jgi:hypothetical protein
MSRVIVAIALVVAIPSIGCPRNGGPPPPPPKTASLSLRVHLGAVPGTTGCSNLRGSFTLTPQHLTGSEGTDHEVTRSFDVAGFVETVGQRTFCNYGSVGEGSLKAGTWRIDVQGEGGSRASCVEQLSAGQNALFFTFGSAGCARNGFPP